MPVTSPLDQYELGTIFLYTGSSPWKFVTLIEDHGDRDLFDETGEHVPSYRWSMITPIVIPSKHRAIHATEAADYDSGDIERIIRGADAEYYVRRGAIPLSVRPAPRAVVAAQGEEPEELKPVVYVPAGRVAKMLRDAAYSITNVYDHYGDNDAEMRARSVVAEALGDLASSFENYDPEED